MFSDVEFRSVKWQTLEENAVKNCNDDYREKENCQCVSTRKDRYKIIKIAEWR